MRLDEIAARLECRLDGPAELEIEGVARVEDAGPRHLTFLSNPKYLSKLRRSQAGAVLVTAQIETSLPRLISANPYLDFARAISFFYTPPQQAPGIHPSAHIAESAQIGEDHSIGANAVIGEGVVLGKGAVLHPGVIIYPQARIGDDFTAHSHAVVREYVQIGHSVILQNGCVVGGDGFGFAPDDQGRYHKMIQAGIVILEDEVEIGALTCIDRATVGETRIERGAKIDNLVQIGHGCQVGRDSVLAAQVGLAGTTKVGQRAMLAGQVGVAGHLEIGDDVIATGQTGIGRSVPSGSKVSGSPEMDSGLWRRNYLLMHRFPEMSRTIRRLEKQVADLQRQLNDQSAGDSSATD